MWTGSLRQRLASTSMQLVHGLSHLHVRLFASRSDGDDLAAVVVQDEHLRRPHRTARPALGLLTAVLLQLLGRILRHRHLLAVRVHVELHQALPSVS